MDPKGGFKTRPYIRSSSSSAQAGDPGPFWIPVFTGTTKDAVGTIHRAHIEVSLWRYSQL